MTGREDDSRRSGAVRPRFGIIGCGGIGRWHAKILRSLEGASLAGVTDVDPGARQRAARSFEVPEFASAEALLADGGIDVVSICTPPATHAALVEAAAAAGKHVLVEKPLGIDLAEVDRAVAACAARSVHLGVVHQQRARSATRALHRLVTGGDLGTPLLGAAIHTWYRTSQEFGGHAWRGDAAAGGGMLLEQGIHAVDLLIWFLGDPRWVGGSTAVLARDSSGEDTAVAVIGFASGAMATLVSSTAANLMRDDIAIEVAGTLGGFRLEIRDYDHAEIARLDLAGADGRRARSLPAGEIEALVRRSGGEWRAGPRAWPWRIAARLAGPGRGDRGFRSPRSYLRRQVDRVSQLEHAEPQGHAGVIEAMAAAVAGRGRPLVSGLEARASIAVIEAIHRSQRSGGARIDLNAPPRGPR